MTHHGDGWVQDFDNNEYKIKNNLLSKLIIELSNTKDGWIDRPPRRRMPEGLEWRHLQYQYDSNQRQTIKLKQIQDYE